MVRVSVTNESFILQFHVRIRFVLSLRTPTSDRAYKEPWVSSGKESELNLLPGNDPNLKIGEGGGTKA